MEKKIPLTTKKIIITESNPGPGRPGPDTYTKKTRTTPTGNQGGKDKRNKV